MGDCEGCCGESYHTVAEKKIADLDREVNRKLREGWALYGPQYTFNGGYRQPMVRGALVQRQG